MKKVGNEVNFAALGNFDIPDGGSVAVYDRKGRRALFYRNNHGRFHRTLIRAKRNSPIKVREDDVLITLDTDGVMVKGDLYNVFMAEKGDAT